MKPASLALFVVALLVAMAWPLSSAIGAARASGAARSALRDANCSADTTAAAPDEGDDDDDDDATAELSPGHPGLALPPGHPPIAADGLPPGHPPIGNRLPPGHPPIPSGRSPASPSPVELFGAPVLLNI